MQQSNLKVKPNEEKIHQFVLIEFLLAAAMIFFETNMRYTVVSVAFYSFFIILLIYFIYVGSKKRQPQEFGFLITIIVVSLIFLLVNTLAHGERITFAYLREYIIFCATLIFFFVSVEIKINKKTKDFILRINVVIGLLYIFANYFVKYAYSRDLRLGFPNANFLGMFLYLTILYCIIGVICFKQIFWKIFTAVVGVWDYFLLTKTNSRNDIVALWLLAAVIAFVVFMGIIKFPKWFALFINIVPIIFVPIYLTYINLIQNRGWFSFMVGTGKDLDSRVNIWTNKLETLGNSWLIGDYYNLRGNAHNSHMVMLCSFGAIVLVLTTVFLYRICIKANESCRTYKNTIALSAFFGMIFMGLGEGSVFSGGLSLPILAGGYLMLAGYDFAAEEKGETEEDKEVLV